MKTNNQSTNSVEHGSAKFTKGEWIKSEEKKQKDFGDQSYWAISVKYPEVVDKSYKAVGFYYPHSVQSKEEMEANATLISAAPDMYFALKAAYEKFSKFNFIWEGRETNEGQFLLSSMKAALQKAVSGNASINFSLIEVNP